MTPEGSVKNEIKKFLRQMGVWYHMPVLNGMGKPSLDFLCCYKGRFFAIEAKRPGATVTIRQQQTIEEIRRAKGTAWVIDSADRLVELQIWLETL
jgi:hypothetical protein